MTGEFTDRWTTAAAKQIEQFITATLVAEREACAKIAEEEAGTCGCAGRVAATIRERKNSDNDVLRNCP